MTAICDSLQAAAQGGSSGKLDNPGGERRHDSSAHHRGEQPPARGFCNWLSASSFGCGTKHPADESGGQENASRMIAHAHGPVAAKRVTHRARESACRTRDAQQRLERTHVEWQRAVRIDARRRDESKGDDCRLPRARAPRAWREQPWREALHQAATVRFCACRKRYASAMAVRITGWATKMPTQHASAPAIATTRQARSRPNSSQRYPAVKSALAFIASQKSSCVSASTRLTNIHMIRRITPGTTKRMKPAETQIMMMRLATNAWPKRSKPLNIMPISGGLPASSPRIARLMPT